MKGPERASRDPGGRRTEWRMDGGEVLGAIEYTDFVRAWRMLGAQFEEKIKEGRHPDVGARIPRSPEAGRRK